MKIKLLIICCILSGCAFDEPLTGLNNALSSTNSALNNVTGLNPQNSYASNSNYNKDKDIDCDKESKKFEDGHRNSKNKIYSKNPREQVRISDAKQKEMSDIQYKLIRYCNDRYASKALAESTDINKEYIDKLKLENAARQINGGK